MQSTNVRALYYGAILINNMTHLRYAWISSKLLLWIVCLCSSSWYSGLLTDSCRGAVETSVQVLPADEPYHISYLHLKYLWFS